MAITRLNSLAIPAGTVEPADISYPLTNFSSTGIDDNASSTVMTIASSGEITFTGDVVISEATPAITLDDADNADGELKIVQSTGSSFYRTRGVAGNGAHVFQRNDGTTNLKIFQTNTSGDVIFYENDGVTSGLTWDASASKLTNFASTGIVDNSTSTAITIDSSGDVDLSGSFKYGNSGISASDADTASQPGFYQTDDLSTATNYPASIGGSGPASLATIAGHNVNNHTQLAFGLNGNNAFLRTYRASSYKDWLQIITDDGSGNVGIGTDSPDKPLHIFTQSGGNTTTPLVLQNNQTTANTAVEIRLAPSTQPNDIGSTARWSAIKAENTGTGNGTGLSFWTNASSTDPVERMRITSGGDVLVGTTDTPLTLISASTGDGIGITGTDGYISISRDFDGAALYLNKTNNAGGQLIQFREDGTNIGSIGIEGGDSLYIQGGTTNGAGLLCHGNAAKILPVRNGASIDATIDLGQDSRRFQDLYLSGGAYLGGTGSANYLDDYEEGTFDITLTDSHSGSDTLKMKYVKIGKVVTIEGPFRGSEGSNASSYFQLSGTANSNLTLSCTLPFTPKDSGCCISPIHRNLERISDGLNPNQGYALPVLAWAAGNSTCYLTDTQTEKTYNGATGTGGGNTWRKADTRTNVVVQFNAVYMTDT